MRSEKGNLTEMLSLCYLTLRASAVCVVVVVPNKEIPPLGPECADTYGRRYVENDRFEPLAIHLEGIKFLSPENSL
ncbi:hypothetical protein R3P38DRAFT_3128550 [Favolaschia claudopus]|uniref:Secreted protein n=1 Tax=Favolaschia claudopus TaxID=2862362 RepID=A0AAV9Z9Z2_9AGAR